MEYKPNHNRKRHLSFSTFTCIHQPPIKRRRLTTIDSNDNQSHNDLIKFTHKLNNKIPGLISSLSNIEKGEDDDAITKLYQFTRNYFKQTNGTNDDLEFNYDDEITDKGFDHSDLILEDELQTTNCNSNSNGQGLIEIDEIREHDDYDVNDSRRHKKCPYSANGNKQRYLELKEWVSKDSRAINFGTTTSSYRNFIVELGERFCTNENLSKVQKVIQFNSKLKTFGVKFDKCNSGDAQNACIFKSYDIDWKPKKRKLAMETLPSGLRLRKKKGKSEKQKKKISIGNSVDSAMKYLNKTPKAGVFFLFGYRFDWNQKVLQFKTANNAKDANIFIQFRLKKDDAECTNTDYKYEFRVFTDWNKYAHQLELWQKAVCQIISLEIFKQVSQISNYPFDLHGWQAWYRPFKREIKTLPGIQFEYFGIDKQGNGTVYSTPTAYAVKSEYYILIDPAQTENRLTKYINGKSIVFSKLSKENLNGDSLLQFPIDSYIWEIRFDKEQAKNEKILQHITMQQFVGYFLMIHTRSAGVAEFTALWNRIKHWAENGYIYGTNATQEKDYICGIRKLGKEWKPHLYYTTDEKMLKLLGEQTGFTMCAANCYFGPGSSKLDKHKEDYKFTGIIWSKCIGEEGQLAIGPKNRGKTNYLWAIPTPSGSYIGYESQGCSMTIDGHAVIPTHLIWKKYQFRICDLYRFVKPELLKLANQHEKECNPQKNIVCKCINYLTKYEDLPKAIDLFD